MRVLNRHFRSKLYSCAIDLSRTLSTDHPAVKHRLKVLDFYSRYGLQASLEAFGISKSTLFNWRKAYRSGGLRGLLPLPKTPLHKRQSSVPLTVIDQIRLIRHQYPCLNQTAVRCLLEPFCKQHGHALPSCATIARIIAKLKAQGRLPSSRQLRINAKTGRIKAQSHKYKAKVRRGSYAPSKPGDLLQIDSVHVFIDGIKRYLITAVDVQTRFAFSFCYNGLTSSNAQDFLSKVQKVYPYPIERVQTDNGLEFHKHFDQALSQQGLIHYFNYPQSPKSNAFIERFNRTLREQFINVNRESFYDRNEVNQKLMQYLIWYNTQKPHQGLKWMTPLDYTLKALHLTPQKSNMYRDLTGP